MRGRWQVGALSAAVDGVRSSTDHEHAVQLADGLSACATSAAELANASAGDEVIPDQAQIFADIASRCSAMTGSLSSDDVAGVGTSRVALEAVLVRAGEIFDAFDALLEAGDADEPA